MPLTVPFVKIYVTLLNGLQKTRVDNFKPDPKNL